MKKLFLSFAMLLAFVSCSSDGGTTDDGGTTPTPTPGTDEEVVVTASLESPEGLTFAWPEKAVIAVFRSARNEKFEYTGEENKFKKADKTKLTGEVPTVYGVYPRKTTQKVSEDGVMTISLPSSQTYVAGGVDFSVNPMVAAAENLQSTELPFKNLCGYLCVKVYGTIPAIKSVEIQSRSEATPLAGGVDVQPQYGEELTYILADGDDTISLDCGEEGVTIGTTAEDATPFYFIVGAQKLERGLTIVFTDAEGKQKKIIIEDEIEIKRNEITTLPTQELAVVSMGEVLVDVKFGADNTAEDKGAAALTVRFIDPNEYSAPLYPVENRPVLAKTYAYGDGYIARFNQTPSGMGDQTSYFLADYSTNTDLQEALADGFTMEVVYMNTVINGGDAFIASAGNWGIGMGSNNSNAPIGSPLRAYYNAGSVAYQSWGIYLDSATKPSPVVFNHALYVYDQQNAKVLLYLNGKLEGEMLDVADFELGTELAIGAASYTDTPEVPNDLGIHGFAGDVASVKIYNSVKSADEAKALYEATTLPVWNPVQETKPEPIYDAKFNDDGSVTNNGTMQSLDTERMTAADGTTPYMKTIQVGNHYVVNFTHTMAGDVCPNKDWNPNNFKGTNASYPDGSYYRVGWENTEFDGALVDGDFTLEIICAATSQDDMRVPASTASIHPNQRGSKYWIQGILNNATKEWKYYSDYAINVDEYHHFVYVSNVDGKRMQCAYVNGKQDSGFSGHGDIFANPHCLIIGACIWPDQNMTRPYHGNVAAVRVYDRSLSPSEVGALYGKAKVVIDELNDATTNVEIPDPTLLANVKFAVDATATPTAQETVAGYTITSGATGAGGTMTVNGEGIATFDYDPENISYFKLDLAQDETLKTEMNNGFTIEFVASAPNTNTFWGCPFGAEGFSLVRLHSWGYKWNINGWSDAAEKNWFYADGTIAPEPDKYYHVLYTYDADTNLMSVYRDSEYENNKTLMFEMRENSTMLIGARYDNDATTIVNPWGGNIASLKIYKEPINFRQAKKMYDAAKADVDALNANVAQ